MQVRTVDYFVVAEIKVVFEQLHEQRDSHRRDNRAVLQPEDLVLDYRQHTQIAHALLFAVERALVDGQQAEPQ